MSSTLSTVAERGAEPFAGTPQNLDLAFTPGSSEAAAERLLLGRRLGAAGSEGEIEILRRAGERLGTALATVLSALDIGDVILSGPEPVATETFRQATLDAVAARTMPEISELLTLRASSFGDDDVVLGAAALVLDEELDIR